MYLLQITISDEEETKKLTEIKNEKSSELNNTSNKSSPVNVVANLKPIAPESPIIPVSQSVPVKDESLEESEEDEEMDVREMEGRTVTPKGQQVQSLFYSGRKN